MFRGFKEFAVKGNAVDMAVGLIIGAAFGSSKISSATSVWFARNEVMERQLARQIIACAGAHQSV